MKPPPFEYHRPTSIEEACRLLATLENAKLTTNRAQTLLSGPAGQQSTYDAAIASQQAQQKGAQQQAADGRAEAE